MATAVVGPDGRFLKVNAALCALVGIEALVRWDRPGRGQLLPAEFVPFAEETGLIVPLGAWAGPVRPTRPRPPPPSSACPAWASASRSGDFGTGYSSLASPRYLPLSSLKIDRSFVARLDLAPPTAPLVAAVIGLGHTLGLTVVAEGVETSAQLAMLDELGCDHAQGHLFVRPDTASRVGELLGHDRRWQ